MQIEEQERKRKRRMCSTTHSLEKAIIQDCRDAEKAKTTGDAYIYTFKEKVISAAKKQAELIHKECNGTDQLEKELRLVTIKIRDRFTNEGHKREVTRIISKEFDGKYTRKYTPGDYELLRYGKMNEYAECTDLAVDAIEKMEQARQTINADVMSDKARNDLDDTTKDLRVDSVKWVKRNNITWNYRPSDDQTPFDLNEKEGSDDDDSDKTSLEIPPESKDEAVQREKDELNNELIGLLSDFEELKQSSMKYPPDEPEIIRYFKNGIKSLRWLFKPYKDNKSRPDIPQWFQILSELFNLPLWNLVNSAEPDKLVKQSVKKQQREYNLNEMYEEVGIDLKKHDNGLHTLSHILDYIDPETGKIKQLEISGKHEHNIKKQIDTMNIMEFIVQHFPALLMASLYYRSKKEGFKQKRTDDTKSPWNKPGA